MSVPVYMLVPEMTFMICVKLYSLTRPGYIDFIDTI